MKYIIVSLLGGTVQDYHQRLVQEISEKFGVNFLAKQKAPTHFTLKDIFEAQDLEQMDQILKNFVLNHKPARIYLEGYNRFEDNVIFMDIKLSEEAEQLFHLLMLELKKIDWMQWGTFDDEKRSFHCSLAYFDIKEKYMDICRFLLKNYSYSFEAYFDNIAVFQQREENWELYKIYKMTYDTM